MVQHRYRFTLFNGHMTRITFLLTLLLTTSSVFAILPSATRWDMSVSPYKYDLQTELVRAVNDFRTAVNQTGIEPTQDRQLRAEIDRLNQLLRSRGYYQATVTSAFDEEKAKPKYQIELGTRYRVASINIKGDIQPSDDRWQTLEPGDALNAPTVLAQQSKLRTYVAERNCYFNLTVNHEVLLNDAKRNADVIFTIRVSDPTTFGDVSFSGIDDIQEDFLLRVTGLNNGLCYQRRHIDSAVISLFDTGLFRQVRPTVTRSENGKVNVLFTVTKRKDRTVSASAGWKSDQGFGVRAGWQHRNLFGRAQSLNIRGALQSDEQSAAAEIVIPSFYDRRNRLSWLNQIVHQDLELESYEYSSTASLERKASNDDYFEYGIGYQQIDENDGDVWQSFRQIRVPMQYRFDSVRNPFNPQNGFRWSVAVEPVFDIEDQYSVFFKTGLGAQAFLADNDRFTLASRVKWDAIWTVDEFGSTLDNVPESELYSAGGSTSVRGYGYQSIRTGLFNNDNELGGLQRGLVVNELRMRLNDTWGLVGFWDRAAVSNDVSSLVDDEWFDSAGAGVRFFTSFAPLRFDVAFPLDARENDDRFLLYFSLGQAF